MGATEAEERDRMRLANVDIGLSAGYFVIAKRLAFFHQGCRLTVPQSGGYRTPTQQSGTNATGASGYNGATSFSKHQSFPARALDFMVVDAGGRLIIDGHHPLYEWCGSQFEALGYKWGGRFQHPDWDHVEIVGPQPTFQEVRAGFDAFKKQAGVRA